ncbi:hypothetical protein FB566_4464 [Stackebrandtia endophytica]|uniref:Arsenate reductase n=1 Tax=Stackebrandtia endophytica TaxID=1496996 RepID=A0A543B210_9ACTN|nr:hypothetical protein [Stackebrandtia endophytica]TQL78869.1 hypothetical protein FB566_4464 [Stackebrandtia endophytica]
MADDNWAPDECTLPTAQQPLRVAEFGELFATSLRAIERIDPSNLRLVLAEGSRPELERLIAAETECCSFFRFSTRPLDDGLIDVTVTVPDSRSDVLDGVARQAQAALA